MNNSLGLTDSEFFRRTEWSPSPLDIPYSVSSYIPSAAFDVSMLPGINKPNTDNGGIEFFLGPNIRNNPDAILVVESVIKDLNCSVLSLNKDFIPTRNESSQLSRYTDYVIDIELILPRGFALGVTYNNDRSLCDGKFVSNSRYILMDVLVTDFQISNSTLVPQDEYSFRNILAHEMGHLLGLAHVNEYFSDNPLSKENFWDSDRGSLRILTAGAQYYNLPPRDIFEPAYQDGLNYNLEIWSNTDIQNCNSENYILDGQGQQCPLNGVPTKINQTIDFYPNPVNSKLHISDSGKYEIFSMLGVSIQEGSFDKEIDVSSLDIGIYLLKTDKGTNSFVKE